MYFDIKASGQRIWELRRREGWTQEKLGELCGVSEGYIGKLEKGLYGGSIDLLIVIAEIFSTSLDYLILGREHPHHTLKHKLRIIIDLMTILEKEV